MNKVAKLVWFEFGVRVVVNDNATDKEIYETAIEKVVKDGVKNHISMDHVTDVEDDTECPYNPEKEFDYAMAEHLLNQHLRACYPLTDEMKKTNEEPTWDCIGGMQLCYDEGNEEIRTGDWSFWHELPIEVRQYVLRKFMEQ